MMNDSATSLDRLHDLALPPEVSWWPLAPAWHAVIALLLVVAAWMARRVWRHWQSNAYRRDALSELKSLEDPAAIAGLLRRTALAIAPRPEIAEMTGSAWLDWLAAQTSEAIPDAVRTQLTAGVYGRPAANQELNALRDYAARWISRHRLPAC
jgi:hypothetical protein